MAFELNELSGSLWPNDRKSNDRQPDFQGSIKIEGVEYWMSAWSNQSKGGKNYLSMAFEPKENGTATVKSSPKSAMSLGPTSLADKKKEFDDLTGAKDLTDADVPF